MLTLEIILFVAAILFGIVWYWKESKGNGIYRFFNKLMNSKELQMKATETKGFVYRQPFLLRLVFVSVLFLIGILVVRFLIPIDIATISAFASMIVGTLIGTYVAGGVFKSAEVIDEHSDSLEDLVQNTIEKGKDFIEDLKSDSKEEVKEEVKKEEEPKEEKKSARERLKDKGYL
ncbi:hypothetical protein ACSIGC_05055 [Tenacibaculum sp. ZS6-P6]|uniref:hypothetical protein n=1 Tax=Tenacibaculum sp. ZS6-P6 TaxID=3447503 RepID=UPI003F98BB01